MKSQILSAFVVCVILFLADSGIAGAATARSVLAELAGLEKDVHSISQMGSDGKDRYTKKISDLRSRLVRAGDTTSEQRHDASRRLAAISSEVRRKTIDTGRSASGARSTVGSSRSSTKFPLSSSRTRSTSRQPIQQSEFIVAIRTGCSQKSLLRSPQATRLSLAQAGFREERASENGRAGRSASRHRTIRSRVLGRAHAVEERSVRGSSSCFQTSVDRFDSGAGAGAGRKENS